MKYDRTSILDVEFGILEFKSIHILPFHANALICRVDFCFPESGHTIYLLAIDIVIVLSSEVLLLPISVNSLATQFYAP